MKKLALIFLFLLPRLCLASSFTISGAVDSSLIKMTRITNYESKPYYNYGGNVLAYVGSTSDPYVTYSTLLHFTTLADSMRLYATGVIINWDSARVALTTGTSGVTATVAFYKLKRAWGEGISTGAATLGCSWVNADSTAGARVLWGTAGALNTTSDVSATAEVRSTVIPATSNTTFYVPISGATITDTLGGVQTGGLGVILRESSGSSTAPLAIHSDDATTAAYRPSMTVYYSVIFADTLRPNAAGSTTQWTKSTGTYNYQCVDEVVASDADYVSETTLEDVDIYNLSATTFGDTVTIVKVTVGIRAKASANGKQFQAILRPVSTNYYGSAVSLTTSYTNYSTDWTTNPATSSAWSLSDLAGLQAGGTFSDVSGTEYMSQVWVVVWAKLTLTTSELMTVRATNSAVANRGHNTSSGAVRGKQ